MMLVEVVFDMRIISFGQVNRYNDFNHCREVS
jgi:hypothetical protein